LEHLSIEAVSGWRCLQEVEMASSETAMDKANTIPETGDNAEALAAAYGQPDASDPSSRSQTAQLDSIAATTSDLMGLIAEEIRTRPFYAVAVAALLGFVCGARR
jgi:ElaB/YqjD/DUF883 family membrane-anchored ribosome-binding protein